MARKKGDLYKCDDCGLVILIESPCDCEDTGELICCGEPMKPVKAPAKKVVPKAVAKSKAKPKPKASAKPKK